MTVHEHPRLRPGRTCGLSFLPNRFWCGSSEDEALSCRGMLPLNGVTEERLRSRFGDTLKEVSYR
jgi:hypothetical protein